MLFESWFGLLLTNVHKWHYVSRVKCYFRGLGLSTDLSLIRLQDAGLRSAWPEAACSYASCRLEKTLRLVFYLCDDCTLPDWAVLAPGTMDNPFFPWSHGKMAFGLVLCCPNICLNVLDLWTITAPVRVDHTEFFLVIPDQLYHRCRVIYLHCSILCMCIFSLLEGLGSCFCKDVQKYSRRHSKKKLVVNLDTRQWDFRGRTQPFSEKCVSISKFHTQTEATQKN